MSDLIVLKSIEQTCPAYPSQWDAVTDEGKNVYIRYRDYTLTIDVCPVPGDVDYVGSRIEWDQIASIEPPIDSSGEMTLEELQDFTNELINWDKVHAG